MITAGQSSSAARVPADLLSLLDRRFEALVFDWDGTAVTDRATDAAELRSLVESLCAVGMEIVIVSGTHVGNVDGQLRARPRGPGRLYLCLNRGSEAFAVDRSGPRVLERRHAMREENRCLDLAAELLLGQHLPIEALPPGPFAPRSGGASGPESIGARGSTGPVPSGPQVRAT